MAEEFSALVVDDEKNVADLLKLQLVESGFYVDVANDGAVGINKVQSRKFDVILLDLKMPRINGLEVLKFVKENQPDAQVLILTGYGDIKTAVDSIKMGAFDFITKPYNFDELLVSVNNALEMRRLIVDNKVMKMQLGEGKFELVGQSPALQKVVEVALKVAPSDASVLITGPSGSGKELIAHLVHENSERSRKPFVALNCASIPDTLIESELFGHERGAFTGAVNMKRGKLEMAEGGTIFLDEIGEMPLDLQVKLLHVLENRQFTRVGGTIFLQSAARVVAATNRNLKDDVESGRFRKDLYYRLKVVYLHVPPLRERKEDISLLVQHFISKHGDTAKKSITGIDPDAVEILRRHSWSGNVRELENVILQAMIFARGGQITIDSLPAEIRESVGPLTEHVPATKEELQKEKLGRTEKVLMDLERQFLLNLIEKSGGNISEAARTSGYDRRQIQNLVKKHGIDLSKLRDG